MTDAEFNPSDEAAKKRQRTPTQRRSSGRWGAEVYMDPLNKKSVDNLRPCIKDYYENGAASPYDYQKMRHAIIADFARLGYDPIEIKNALVGWNGRCKQECRASDEDRYLRNYVDWYFKQDGKFGCKALEQYCIGEEKCWFHLKSSQAKDAETRHLPFDLMRLEDYLTEAQPKKVYVCMIVIRELRRYQVETNTGRVMYIGFKGLGDRIREHFRHEFASIEVSRIVNLLIEVGVVEKVEKGKRGEGSRLANGYMFLPWTPPENLHSRTDTP